MTEIPLEHVHVAPNDGSDAAPAVFVLHGRGADEEDLLPVAESLPDELHVISLRAPDPLQGGYTWYELDLSGGGLHESQPHAEDFRRSLDRIAESVSAATDAYGLDADRIGLLGFSQGAITSLSLLLEDPDSYGWVVGLHGYLPDSHLDLEPDGIGGKPVFVGAGTGDRVIPESRAEAAADRLAEVGADVTYETYATGHGIGREELADVVAFVEARLR
ncbi:phospholipase/carboxylesterase [Halorubrum aquaticum]|uniref:Phospholipase/carboxylesterase n=1 Tax=Halorubrum aquaticum TaxID=387340 RepID=A0A1I3BYI1_9EURY|nr:dienelactone hydrolase family protein [Halorubrum aquaticum]SFH66801.1 phospholipase/carboxylesterase [Halorubrum aquaticum]